MAYGKRFVTDSTKRTGYGTRTMTRSVAGRRFTVVRGVFFRRLKRFRAYTRHRRINKIYGDPGVTRVHKTDVYVSVMYSIMYEYVFEIKSARQRRR